MKCLYTFCSLNLVVLENGPNDSLTFKVNFFDFRGKPDSSRNVSPNRFNASTYETHEERTERALKYA